MAYKSIQKKREYDKSYREKIKKEREEMTVEHDSNLHCPKCEHYDFYQIDKAGLIECRLCHIKFNPNNIKKYTMNDVLNIFKRLYKK